jgi:beta-phosphoglucomutase-like phosphatase (HAD superfamily)
LRDRFSVVRCRDHVARAKPHPDLYLAACEALHVAPTDAIAIEDSRNGTLAAKAAGLVCVACPNSITRGTDLSAADLVVDSLADLTIDNLRRLTRRPTRRPSIEGERVIP